MENNFTNLTAAVVGLGLMGGSYAKRLTALGMRRLSRTGPSPRRGRRISGKRRLSFSRRPSA